MLIIKYLYNMSNIKRNLFIRGLFNLYRQYFGYKRSSFGYVGKDTIISSPIHVVNPKNVFLYDNTKIDNAVLLCSNAKFILKANSGTAQGLKVSTGAHERIIGRFYRSITEKEKSKGLDKDVIVENDVWIGMNVTLLAGVTIGRGSTIAAGAVVSKSMPPYCVCGGVPCKPIKRYWTIDEILQHEAVLYPEEERFTRKQLEEIYSKYNF